MFSTVWMTEQKLSKQLRNSSLYGNFVPEQRLWWFVLVLHTLTFAWNTQYGNVFILANNRTVGSFFIYVSKTYAILLIPRDDRQIMYWSCSVWMSNLNYSITKTCIRKWLNSIMDVPLWSHRTERFHEHNTVNYLYLLVTNLFSDHSNWLLGFSLLEPEPSCMQPSVICHPKLRRSWLDNASQGFSRACVCTDILYFLHRTV